MTEKEIIREGSQATLFVGTDLISSTVPKIKSDLKQLLDDGVSDLSIDLSAATTIDSAGIGCIVATSNSIQQTGGNLAVSGASAEIYQLFSMINLDRHFSIIQKTNEGNHA